MSLPKREKAPADWENHFARSSILRCGLAWMKSCLRPRPNLIGLSRVRWDCAAASATTTSANCWRAAKGKITRDPGRRQPLALCGRQSFRASHCGAGVVGCATEWAGAGRLVLAGRERVYSHRHKRALASPASNPEGSDRTRRELVPATMRAGASADGGTLEIFPTNAASRKCDW